MSHCVSFYYSFSFWFIIWFVMLFWKGTFWNFPMTHWMSNRLLISGNVGLVVLHSLMYIRRLSCLRERTIKFRFNLSSAFFSKILNLDNLDYSIRICHQFSSRSRPLWLHHRQCGPYYISSLSVRHKVSEERSSLEKYMNITNVILTLKECSYRTCCRFDYYQPTDISSARE